MSIVSKLPLAAALLLTASVAVGQGTVTTTEKTTTNQSSATGGVVSSTTTNETTTYETRLEAAYRAAGLAEADLARVKALDLKAREARRAGETARVKEYYTEQVRIVKPEQQQRVYRYFQQNPYPATYKVPAHERTTWEEYYTPGVGFTTPILGASVGGGAGVQVTTPIGGIGIGAPAGTVPASSHVVERTETVPATTVVVPAQR
ncbi:MAG: hypothetical protein ACR2IE_06870 [Candidatus Sumerlaeaceae bacterium]